MNKSVNIYLADDLHPKGIILLKNHFNLIGLKGCANKILLKKIISNKLKGSKKSSVLIIRSIRNIDKQFVKMLSLNTDVKLICTVSAGFDNIDINHCRKLNIDVINVAGANSTSAAEFTFGIILAITKNIISADKDMRKNIYDYSKLSNVEIYGKTLGIIGVGRIGSKVLKLAKAFGMNILGNDIDPKVKAKHASTKFVPLNTLIQNSDIVTIHTPLDSSTFKLINKNNIRLFRKDSILINCSRGGTVDENVLIEALKKNKLKYAGVDVFETEPQFNKKFTKLKNVILTPHLAGKTVESKERMGITAAKNVIEYFNVSESKHKLIN